MGVQIQYMDKSVRTVRKVLLCSCSLFPSVFFHSHPYDPYSTMDVEAPLRYVNFLTEKDAKFKKATNKRKRVGNRIRIGEKIPRQANTFSRAASSSAVSKRAEEMAEESLEGMF